MNYGNTLGGIFGTLLVLDTLNFGVKKMEESLEGKESKMWKDLE